MDVGALARSAARSAGLSRARVAEARMWAERRALALRARPGRHAPRILCYHSVGQPAYGVNDVTPRRFREQLVLVREAGYRFVSAEHIADTGGAPGELAITFDDGLTSVLTRAAPVLAEFGAPATCFVVSAWPDHMDDWSRQEALDWSGVRALHESGVTIGSHSVSHPDFGRLTEEAARRELVESKCRLEDQLGVPINDFAIPFGQASNWNGALSELARSVGYRNVYAQIENRRPPDTVGRTFVTSNDTARTFRAALDGAYDDWQEWY